MPAFQLNWVVALRPEARAVIDRFSLQPIGEAGLFPMYANQDESMRLVISGPGKVNAAAATATLASAGNNAETVSRGWLNFGIAGCGDSCFGETFLGGSVRDSDTEKIWFPIATWPKKHDLPRRKIVTVSQPTSEYPDEGELVEMEAAGFYPIALRDSTVELCQVLKVVSDDPEHSLEKIDKALAIQLCQDALENAESWVTSFCEIGEEDALRLVDPPGFSELLSEVHFTVTQQHQLRRLLQQWHARRPDCAFADFEKGELRDAKTVLTLLRSEIFAME